MDQWNSNPQRNVVSLLQELIPNWVNKFSVNSGQELVFTKCILLSTWLRDSSSFVDIARPLNNCLVKSIPHAHRYHHETIHQPTLVYSLAHKFNYGLNMLNVVRIRLCAHSYNSFYALLSSSSHLHKHLFALRPSISSTADLWHHHSQLNVASIYRLNFKRPLVHPSI